MEFDGVRVSTASTRRSIDMWRGKAKAHVMRSQYLALEYVSRLLTSPRKGKVALVPPLVLALSLNFALFELGVLVMMGFFVAKLHFYRFLNSVAGLIRFSV